MVNDVIEKHHSSSDAFKNVVDEIYIRTLGRKPTAEEFQKVSLAAQAGTGSPKKDSKSVVANHLDKLDKKTMTQFARNLTWALLNSSEFAFNH